MYKLIIIFFVVLSIGCGKYSTIRSDWKIFNNYLKVKNGYKVRFLEKISFKDLDTLKLRSKISIKLFNYSKKRLPLVSVDKKENIIYIFNRLDLVEYKVVVTDSNFNKITILVSSGEEY